MSLKRKRNEARSRPIQLSQTDSVVKPAARTRTYTSGQAVKEALAGGSRQAFVSLHQQILTPFSALPLPIADPAVVILQHYLEISPTCEEIFEAWKLGDETKDDRRVHSAVALLAHAVQLLTPLPFFRQGLTGLVKKLISPAEPYRALLNRLIQSDKRELSLIALQLAAASVYVDPPDPASGGHSSTGKLALRVWAALAEGGSVRTLSKSLGLRRRNRDGTTDYGGKDPLDRPDIRHAILQLISPLLPLPTFQANSKLLLRSVYSYISTDPPITVLRILTAVWTAITAPTAGIGRHTALALLDENALEHVLQLFGREDVESSSGQKVSEMAMAFLGTVTTVPGQAICFADEGWYPRQPKRDILAPVPNKADEMEETGRERGRRGLHNRILSNVVRKLGTRVIDDDGRVGEWAVKVFKACPELVSGYWAYSNLSLEPRLSARWMATMAYIGQMVSLPPPHIATFHQTVSTMLNANVSKPRSNPPAIDVMVESIIPSPLTKVHLTKGLTHSDSLVRHMTALTLARGLQKLDEVNALLHTMEVAASAEPSTSSESPWARCRRELDFEVRRRTPEVPTIIQFAQQSATLARLPDLESDEEPDPALVAKCAMLTESALRLFRLYYKTLPSIAYEAKFDVGRLLVSSSSAREERRQRREGRAGSVLSDSGSVGSVGTVGTAGMGGGFGEARGDIEGFEAMSQVHVLALLGEVRDWKWTNKAAGSQFTYFYHILLLHLSTTRPVTREHTTSLISRLLRQSILFEHDPPELQIWLPALPYLPEPTLTQRADIVIQRIYLLSFLDDCFRRAIKTPYRYIDDMMALVPTYFSPAKAHEMPSPIIMTIVEQLRAKMLGELISTDACSVVLQYLRRLVLGMAGKMRDDRWLRALYGKLHGILEEARAKGQERTGLQGHLSRMENTLNSIYGGRSEFSEVEGSRLMVDEEEWSALSFEASLLSALTTVSSTTDLALMRTLPVDQEDQSTLARRGHLMIHLLSAHREVKARRGLLDLLNIYMQNVHDVELAGRLRTFAFDAEQIRGLLLKVEGSKLEPQLHGLVEVLSVDNRQDAALAEPYTHALMEMIKSAKTERSMQHALAKLRPFARFLSSAQATTALSLVGTHSKHFDDASKLATGLIVLALDDPAIALKHAGKLIPVGVIRPFTLVLLRPTSASLSDRETPLEVIPGTLGLLLDSDHADAAPLINALVSRSAHAARSFIDLLPAHTETVDRRDLLPTFCSILDLSSGLDATGFAAGLSTTALNVLKDHRTDEEITIAAEHCLVLLAKSHPVEVEKACASIHYAVYSTSLARLAKTLASMGASSVTTIVNCLVEVGLQYVVRLCSSDAKLSTDDLASIHHLEEAIRRVIDLRIDLVLAEPVITAVIQQRLGVSEATELAVVLCQKGSLKASFVRQHIQLLFDSTTYRGLSDASTDLAETHRSFVSFVFALFTASPYASCQPTFIESLLGVYRGTVSSSDRKILAMFQLFEKQRKVSVLSVLRCWNPNGIVKAQPPIDAILSLDAGKVFATCSQFPLRRHLLAGFEDKEILGGEKEDLYDPPFVLPLLAAVLQEELSGLQWVEILRSNTLGLTICALASRDGDLRFLASSILLRVARMIETNQFQEQAQILYILRLLRHSVVPTDDSKRIPRLPTLTTLFLAHTLRSLASPSHFLYPLVSRFLMQRSVYDLKDVPMLFSMLYAGGEGWKSERSWIVRFIRDGARSAADWRILKNRHVVSLLETLYASSMDPTFRRSVFSALEAITAIPSASVSLAHRTGFISWLHQQWIGTSSRPLRSAEDEKRSYLLCLENLVVALCSDEIQRHNDMEASKVGKVLRRLSWVRQVERLILRAIDDADAARLEHLSRIVFRVSEIPKSPIAHLVLPKLVQHLKLLSETLAVKLAYNPSNLGEHVSLPVKHGSTLNTLHNSAEERNISLDKVTTLLFRTSLSLEPRNCMGELREAVDLLGVRVGSMPGELGDWVRRERRIIEWEEVKKVG